MHYIHMFVPVYMVKGVRMKKYSDKWFKKMAKKLGLKVKEIELK